MHHPSPHRAPTESESVSIQLSNDDDLQTTRWVTRLYVSNSVFLQNFCRGSLTYFLTLFSLPSSPSFLQVAFIMCWLPRANEYFTSPSMPILQRRKQRHWKVIYCAQDHPQPRTHLGLSAQHYLVTGGTGIWNQLVCLQNLCPNQQGSVYLSLLYPALQGHILYFTHLCSITLTEYTKCFWKEGKENSFQDQMPCSVMHASLTHAPHFTNASGHGMTVW